MKRHIFAMSEERAQIHRTLSAASRQIDYHMIKLLLYPDDTNAYHWKQEVVNFLYDIDRLKGSNKWPKEKFIYEALACHNDIIYNYRTIIEDEYPMTPSDITDDEIVQALEDYQHYLAEQLSTYGVVNRKEAYKILNQIIFRYRV